MSIQLYSISSFDKICISLSHEIALIEGKYIKCIILFSAQFQMVGGSKSWGSMCGYDFYSNDNGKKTGTFYSPGYPQNYPPQSTCNYKFHGLKNERVRITFQNIQLEAIDGRYVYPDLFLLVHNESVFSTTKASSHRVKGYLYMLL